MSEFKPGDAVMMPLYVAGVHDPMVVISGNSGAAANGLGNWSAMATEVTPWHPALPAVARWLAEYPDASDAIALFVGEADFGESIVDIDPPLAVMNALIAALGQGATT